MSHLSLKVRKNGKDETDNLLQILKVEKVSRAALNSVPGCQDVSAGATLSLRPLPPRTLSRRGPHL